MLNNVGSVYSNKYIVTQGQTAVNNLNAATVPIGQESPALSNDSQEKTDNKLKLALIGLGVLALGAVGTAIYVKTKKKLPTAEAFDLKNVSEKTTDIQKGIKKFLNSAGESVDNVKLQKGKAVLDDGSGFSGVLKTVNGKGQDIAVKYQDGFMTESTINGKLFKKFENLQSRPNVAGANKVNYSRSQGVAIKTFGENGNLKKEVSHLYDKNGKISRVFDGENATDFLDGKVVGKAKFSIDGLETAEIFDKNGNVIRTVERQGNGYSILDSLPNGEKKKRTGFMEYDLVDTPATGYGKKMIVREVVSYDSKGKIKESINLFDLEDASQLSAVYADGSDLLASIPKRTEIKNGDTALPKFDYMGPEGSNSECYAVIDSSGKNKAINKHPKEDLETLSKRVKELEVKAKEEGFDFPYERLEKYLAQIFNS